MWILRSSAAKSFTIVRRRQRVVEQWPVSRARQSGSSHTGPAMSVRHGTCIRQVRFHGWVRIMANTASRATATGGEGLINRFGDETVTVACRTLGAAWGSFYRIGGGQQPFGFRTHGIPHEFGVAYAREEMQQVDPLHPFRMVPRRQRFLTMGDTRADNPARHRAFVSFLHSYGAQDAAEMIFSYRDKAVAGLSLCWTDRKPEHRQTVELGGALQSYIEFNL